MKPTFKRIMTMSAGVLLLACADIAYRQPPADPVPLALRAYQSGRAHHLAGRLDEARTAYLQALQVLPSQRSARNGLAVLDAEQGQLDSAIAHWTILTAGASGVETGYLYSNLGYALYLRGDHGQAQAALEQACLQDPLNYRAWRHLGNVLARLGQHQRASAMQRQAAALQGHDFKSDYALATGSRVAAIDQAVRAASDDPRWARTIVHRGADGMFVLERIEAPQPASVLLEISNGNGVTGMARSIARSIGTGEGRVVRLTNQKGFAVRQTRIEYQPDFKLAAERLAERVGAVRLIEAGAGAAADIRVVLGRDLVKPARASVAGSPTALPGRS